LEPKGLLCNLPHTQTKLQHNLRIHAVFLGDEKEVTQTAKKIVMLRGQMQKKSNKELETKTRTGRI